MVSRLAIAITCFMLWALDFACAGPLHDAAKKGDIVTIELLLAQGADVNQSSGFATPLYYAIYGKRVEAAELLIERGADVNGQSTPGSPLHAATTKDLTSLVILLLERGADPNVGSKELTPLHVAAQKGNIELVRILLDHGADINAATSMYEPALHLALINGDAEVADLLSKRGTTAPAVEKIDPLMASADAARGEMLAGQCGGGCHSLDREAKIKTGPPLWGVVGRPKASASGFKYSTAFKALQGTWTYADLNEYIAQPAWTVPGMAMKFEGIHEVQDRADIIAYLRMLSDDPMALP